MKIKILNTTLLGLSILVILSLICACAIKYMALDIFYAPLISGGCCGYISINVAYKITK